LVIERNLRKAGYRVLTAGDGLAAMAIIGDSPQTPELVLTDVVMPGMGGPELARRVRDIAPDVEIVFMSAYADDTAFRRNVDLDRFSFIEKPFNAAGLLAAIRAALGEPTPVADPRSGQ
jgi:two-component system cell cycle sensor histidine kinase/response regulator CckA